MTTDHTPKLSLGPEPADSWMQDECLWIQLWHELNFCLAAHPAAPRVLTDPDKAYQSFLLHFDMIPEDGCAPRPFKDFVAKRDMLVRGVIHRTTQANKADRVREGDTTEFQPLEITSSMMDEYRDMRQYPGVGTDISFPERHPQLWNFLDEQVAKQHTDFSPEPPTGTPIAPLKWVDATRQIIGRSGPSSNAQSSNSLAATTAAAGQAGSVSALAAPRQRTTSSPRTQCLHHVSANHNKRCERRVDIEIAEKAGGAICHNHKPGFQKYSKEKKRQILSRKWD
jgi:hypothetical protein